MEMTNRSEVEISEAIQDCAKKCMDHIDPLGCAEAYIVGLIADGWSAGDAKAVEKGALRVLATVKGDDSLWPKD
jgi:hypothetical protein